MVEEWSCQGANSFIKVGKSCSKYMIGDLSRPHRVKLKMYRKIYTETWGGGGPRGDWMGEGEKRKGKGANGLHGQIKNDSYKLNRRLERGNVMCLMFWNVGMFVQIYAREVYSLKWNINLNKFYKKRIYFYDRKSSLYFFLVQMLHFFNFQLKYNVCLEKVSAYFDQLYTWG